MGGVIAVVVDWDREKGRLVALHVFLEQERDQAPEFRRELARDYRARRQPGHEIRVLEGQSLPEIKIRHGKYFNAKS